MVKLGKAGLSNKIYLRMNDQASSAKNRRGKASTIYADVDGGGDALCLAPRSGYSDLSGPLFSDTASSSRLHHGASCAIKRATRFRR